jgi:hypothetical protein
MCAEASTILRAVAADFLFNRIWRSLPITVFCTYSDAYTIMRKAFDWKGSRNNDLLNAFSLQLMKATVERNCDLFSVHLNIINIVYSIEVWKLQTRLLVREGAPYQQTRNYLKNNQRENGKNWSRVPDGSLTPGRTGRLTVDRNITLNLTLIGSNSLEDVTNDLYKVG